MSWAMLVGLAIDEVNSSLCYEFSRPILSRPLSYETLVWLLSAVTCGDSSTMSQAEVPLERIHGFFYRKWVRSPWVFSCNLFETCWRHPIIYFTTSLIWLLTLTALPVLCITEAFNWLGPIIPFWKKVKVHWSPNLVMANTCTIQAWSKSEGSEREWSDQWS